jgi:predicted lipoprotein with Yx(FWY)xxD motif
MNISTASAMRRGCLAAAAIGALALAGCSSSSKGSPAASAPAGGGSGNTTVAVRSVSGTGDVLVDAKGRTLYISDQEMTGKILCSSDACTAIWTPLTVVAGKQPSGPTQVSSMLATVKRPDGSLQVAFNGAPLYTFSFDHAAGDVGGNGQKDSFGGTDFTWQIAIASGVAPAPTTSNASTPNYGNGGY